MANVNVIVAGCDTPVYLERDDSDGAALHPTLRDVTAELNGSVVALTSDPEWDSETERYALLILAEEIDDEGTLVLTFDGTDEDGIDFRTVQEYAVLRGDGPDELLYRRVRDFLRVEDDDPTIWGLILAAQQYLASAGVTRPTTSETLTAQYDIAVALKVSMLWSGDDVKSSLEPALTSFIYQLR